MKRKGAIEMNAQQELEKLMKKNKEQNVRPRILLHSCCAPCSTYVLEYLKDSFQIIDLFFNPNMDSEGEYEKRAIEMNHLVDVLNQDLSGNEPIELIIKDYQSERFMAQIKGLEQEPERGSRCEVCFSLRLKEAALKALELNCDYFATTLTISPLKNANLINRIGQEIAVEYGISYLPTDFKKKNGFLKSTELSKKYNLYRQDYCGCIFSKRESEERYEQKDL